MKHRHWLSCLILALIASVPTVRVWAQELPLRAPTRQDVFVFGSSYQRDRALIDAVRSRLFPKLGDDYEVIGHASEGYNCIAWSLGITTKWVWPGEGEIRDFDALNGRFGYRRMARPDISLQPGVDKIVLFAIKGDDGKWKVTHQARQLRDGSWSSKLGKLPLIRHRSLAAVSGPTYGVPVAVYFRSRLVLAEAP